jgi:hypothetical protein
VSSFGFQFSEDALRNALDAIDEQKSIDPTGKYALEFSCDMVPDGIGFEFYNQDANIVKIMEMEDIEIPGNGVPDMTFVEDVDMAVGRVTVQEVVEP